MIIDGIIKTEEKLNIERNRQWNSLNYRSGHKPNHMMNLILLSGSRAGLKLRVMILVVGLIFGILGSYTISKAASGTVTISSDKTKVLVGEDIIVSIQLTSEALLGDFEAYITYNEEVLEFQKSASLVAGGEGLLKLSDINVEDAQNTRKYIINFKAIDIGKSEITINEKAKIYDYETSSEMSVSVNRLNISVEPIQTASTNTNLKALKISPSWINPEFDSTITEYSTTITEEVEQLIISALPEDDVANVTIEGNENLMEGSNKIIITVRSESGDEKEYKIEAIKEGSLQGETGDEIKNNTESDPLSEHSNNNDVTQINNFLVTKDGENIYIQNGFRYILVDATDSDMVIPEGYRQTTMILNGITVTAYTLQDDLESDFLLIYAKNEKNEEGFYQYDRIEKTLQRYTVNKNGTSTNKYVMTEEIIHSEEYKNRITIMAVIIGVLGALLMTLSIILLRSYMTTKDN